MTSTADVELKTEIIEATKAVEEEVAAERKALRGFKPGDPERERRIEETMRRQHDQSLAVQSLRAKGRWNPDLLDAAEHEILDELTRRLTQHRRQLKKMRR